MCTEVTVRVACVLLGWVVLGGTTGGCELQGDMRVRTSGSGHPCNDYDRWGIGRRGTADSENVMFSVRQNIERILAGKTTYKSYFPNSSGDDLTLEQITNFSGHPEHVEYVDKKADKKDGKKQDDKKD